MSLQLYKNKKCCYFQYDVPCKIHILYNIDNQVTETEARNGEGICPTSFRILTIIKRVTDTFFKKK